MALINREQALSHPFANGQYDKEHADEHFIMGFEDYKEWLEHLPTVEAIPKAEVKKFLEEGTKNVSNNVLAIVREEYIHKADYETHLKADLEAILTELQLEIEELDPMGNEWSDSLDACNELIQQKINALKGNEDNTNK